MLNSVPTSEFEKQLKCAAKDCKLKLQVACKPCGAAQAKAAKASVVKSVSAQVDTVKSLVSTNQQYHWYGRWTWFPSVEKKSNLTEGVKAGCFAVWPYLGNDGRPRFNDCSKYSPGKHGNFCNDLQKKTGLLYDYCTKEQVQQADKHGCAKIEGWYPERRSERNGIIFRKLVYGMVDMESAGRMRTKQHSPGDSFGNPPSNCMQQPWLAQDANTPVIDNTKIWWKISCTFWKQVICLSVGKGQNQLKDGKQYQTACAVSKQVKFYSADTCHQKRRWPQRVIGIAAKLGGEYQAKSGFQMNQCIAGGCAENGSCNYLTPDELRELKGSGQYYTVAEGKDCGGTGLGKLEDGTPSNWASSEKMDLWRRIYDCKTKCREDAKCTAFTWQNSKCVWTKTSTNSLRPSKTKGIACFSIVRAKATKATKAKATKGKAAWAKAAAAKIKARANPVAQKHTIQQALLLDKGKQGCPSLCPDENRVRRNMYARIQGGEMDKETKTRGFNKNAKQLGWEKLTEINTGDKDWLNYRPRLQFFTSRDLFLKAAPQLKEYDQAYGLCYEIAINK